MKGWGLLLVWAVLGPGLVAAQPARPKVVVVKSTALASYSAVVAGFGAEVRAEVSEVLLEDGTPTSAARAFQRVAAQKPALVLAIGPLAANTARRTLVKEVPVLFAMVPYYEKYGLEAPNVTGIALTSDFRPEFDALKALSAQVKRVGVLHDPRFSSGLVDAARAAAEPLGLTLVSLETDGQKVEKVLSGAKDKVDALLMVADKTVGNATVVQELIAFCAGSRLPLVALTPSQVREGATLALAPSPITLGQQAGRLANRIIHEKVDPGALAVAQPEGLELSVNLSAAAKLAGSKDVVLELLRFAARRDYPVRSFE